MDKISGWCFKSKTNKNTNNIDSNVVHNNIDQKIINNRRIISCSLSFERHVHTQIITENENKKIENISKFGNTIIFIMSKAALAILPSVKIPPTQRQNQFKKLVSQFGSTEITRVSIKSLVLLLIRDLANECMHSLF